MDDLRKSFEDWAKYQQLSIYREKKSIYGGEPIYSSLITHYAWLAWCASVDSLVSAIPQ